MASTFGSSVLRMTGPPGGSPDELGLRGRNAFETAEAAHVGVAHAQLDGHVGGDDVRQVGDVTGP